MLDSTQKLLQELYATQDPNFFDRLTGAARARRREILERLGESGDPDALLPLLDYAIAPEPEEAAVARASIALLLAAAGPAAMGRLDERLRAQSQYSSHWSQLKPTDVPFLRHPILLRLATFHTNGYVREEALRSLAALGDGSEIPLLVIRLNDWVIPIRSLAAERLRRMMDPRYAQDWARALPLLLRLAGQTRGLHHTLIRDVRKLLQRPECWPALEEALHDADRHVRREAYRLAKGAIGVSLPMLVALALKDRDALTRLLALREMAREAPERFRDAIAEATHDPFFAVRREALALMEALEGPGFRPRVEAALFDKHVAVREWAQAALERVATELDPRDRYLEALATERGTRLAAAVIGIAEVGRRTDAPLLRPFAANECASVRRAALRALYRLETPAPVDVLLEGLRDPSGSVSSVARMLLAKETLPTMAPGLEALVDDSAQPIAVRRNALWLLARLDKWLSAAALVSATADPELADRARLLLRRWVSRYNRSFAALTPERAQKLRAAVAKAGSHLPKRVAEQLTSILNSAP